MAPSDTYGKRSAIHRPGRGAVRLPPGAAIVQFQPGRPIRGPTRCAFGRPKAALREGQWKRQHARLDILPPMPASDQNE
jgi:hypothetical protein